MRDHLYAAILGIIEGVTEFLPVSSTGHMVIAMPMLNIRASAAPWSTLLWVSQFGAILAVVVYFWRDLLTRAAQPLGMRHLLVQLAASMAPTVILALLFKDMLDPLEESPRAVAIALIVGAVVLWLVDRWARRERAGEIQDITLLQAAAIGAIQAVSMAPGVSRSGASIVGGMLLGLSPRVATQYSFYLAIPTMLAAGVKTLWDHRAELTVAHAGVVATGSLVSFAVAIVVVAWFMEYVKRHSFTPFAVYRIILGVAVLLLAR